MKAVHVLGAIFAIALMIFALAFPTPDKRVRTSSYNYDIKWSDDKGAEYVGGDAYNYQMEASLKAGYMGGVLALKGITFVGGVVLLFLTAFSYIRATAIEEQNRLISGLRQDNEGMGKIIAELCMTSEKQAAILGDLSDIIKNRISPPEEKREEKDLPEGDGGSVQI